MSGSLSVPPNPVAGMYPQAPAPAAINPIGMLQSLAGTQNMLNQNAQFQQQFQAKQAMGEIFQKSIDPSTGQPDMDKAAVNMSLDPRTAFMAGDFIKQMADRKLIQADTVLKQLDAHSKTAGYAAAAMAPAISSGDLGDVVHGLSQAVADGRTDQKTALGFYMNIPKGADGKSVQGPALSQWLKDQQLAFMSAKERIDTVSGSLNARNLGGTTAITRDIPYYGTSTPVAGFPNTPDAATYGKPIERQLPQGGTEVVPQGPGLGMPAPGVLPGFQGNPTSQEMATQAPGIQTGIHPAIQTYYHGDGPLAKYETDLNDRANTAYLSNQTLEQQMEAMRQLGPGGFGGGAEVRLNMANWMRNIPGIKPELIDSMAGGGPGAVAAAQVFQKYAVIGAANAATAALNAQKITGGEFGIFKGEGNPNLNTNPAAVQKLLNYTHAVNQVILDEQRAWSMFAHPGPDGKPNPKFLQNPLGFQQQWQSTLQKSGRIRELKSLYQDAQGAWADGK